MALWKPNFVITGGDQIMDAMGQSYGRADSLYNLYQETVKELKMPVCNTRVTMSYMACIQEAELIPHIRNMEKKCLRAG